MTDQKGLLDVVMLDYVAARTSDMMQQVWRTAPERDLRQYEKNEAAHPSILIDYLKYSFAHKLYLNV